jgi:hypothetical protein
MCWNGQGTKGTQMNDTSMVPELYLLVQEVASFEFSSVSKLAPKKMPLWEK